MSIPKEPRQLMINLMYLVLTALLALNVSAEIINAFFRIDKSTATANKLIESANTKTLASMEEAVEKRTDDKPLYDAAIQAKSISKDFVDYIDGIRDEIVAEAGGMYEGDDPKRQGKPVRYKDKEVPQRFFVEGFTREGTKYEPKGPELKTKVKETREALIKLVDDATAPYVKENRIKQSEVDELKEGISLSIDEEEYKKYGKKSWEEFNFAYMPVAAVYPLLSNFQNDAKNSEAMIVNFLAKQIGATVIEFDKFQPVAAAKKGYIILGDTYEADVFLSAASSQAQVSISVNGSRLNVKDGVAKYSTKPTSVGEKTYKVNISLTNPFTGKAETVNETFSFEVGRRSVSVSADKMNVFYIGVDNPVSVAAAGVSSNKLNVSGSGAGITLNKQSPGKYMVKVNKPGESKITVSADGLTETFTFRAKRIPDPVAKLGGREVGGGMKTGTFKAQEGVFAILENFDFEAKCNIMGFEIARVPKRADPIIERNQGARFSSKVSNMMRAAKPGDIYYFDNIKAKCPGDAAGRKINSMVFNIR